MYAAIATYATHRNTIKLNNYMKYTYRIAGFFMAGNFHFLIFHGLIF